MKTLNLIKFCLIAVIAVAMLPAGSALAAGEYSFVFNAPDQGAVGPVDLQTAFHCTITNTGETSDTYHIHIEEAMPASWTASLCADGICYHYMQDDIDVDASAGEVIYLDIDINQYVDFGQGNVVITVTSDGNSALSEDRSFTAITEGLDVLVVDADFDDPSTVGFFNAALAGSDKSFAQWNRSLHGALSTSEMNGFGSILWISGSSSGGLVNDDRNAMVNYLQLGGKVAFSGQNLAYDVADPASANYNSGGISFLNLILGLLYVNDNTGGTGLDGMTGDIVTQDKTFVLGGGSGHDQNTSPDGLMATGNGSTSLTYSPGGETAAVKSTYGLGRSYFMGFGLEDIASDSGRSDLLMGILAWFDGATPAMDMVNPILAGSLYAAPNPFNPQTSIQFEVGGLTPRNAEIVIFDVRGHVVRNLFQGELTPGLQNMVWNGRNDRGQTLSTGLYMAKVQVGQESEVVKMTLAK